MQNQKISQIISKMKELEKELEDEVQKRREEFFCDMSKKIDFKEEQKKSVENIFHYLRTTPILNILTAPIIWSVIFPALVLDFFVTIYQAICFPVYKIAKVKRSDYIAIDRHNLQYLNTIEKLNCIYCGYFNGLIGYIAEVAARTEQYWCPIKHAQNIKFMHSKYKNFFDYGDCDSFRKELKKLREELAQ